MQSFKSIRSKIIPLPLKDVDTDMIIPAQFLTSVSREGYAENLFRRFRDQDANFPLNNSIYEGAQILCVDSNFACGSSREHAVWALMGAGFKVIIGKSFADIFTSNSAKNGLVLIVLPEAEIDKILKESVDGEYVVEVNLETQTVKLPDGKELNFPFDSFRKHCILNGLDDIDYILSHQKSIQEYRDSHQSTCFFEIVKTNQEGDQA